MVLTMTRSPTVAVRQCLSAREVEVLRLMAAGLTNAGIGMQLGISSHTVKNHITSILEVLCAADRTHAVAIGLGRGIIDFPG